MGDRHDLAKCMVGAAMALLSLGSAETHAAAPPASGLETAAATDGHTAFLVAAPDRGFQGNEEVRDLVETFAASGRRRAELLVVTDERTRDDLDRLCVRLQSAGDGAAPGEIGETDPIDEIVVLPFFLSRAEQRYRILDSLLEERPRCAPAHPAAPAPPLLLARPFGETYYAVELLGDRLREVSHPAGRSVVIAGAGAEPEYAAALQADLQALADQAHRGLGYARVHARVVDLSNRQAPLAVDAADTVVPFALASKLDGMMSFASSLRGRLPAGAQLVGRDLTPDPLVGQWLEREARLATWSSDRIGVLVLAHGSDHHWNEAMRRAIEPLGAQHLVEPVFSMADADLVERGIRRLEARGAEAIVLVRVFGLASSFAGSVEHMLGIDVEERQARDVRPAAEGGAVPGSHDGHGDRASGTTDRPRADPHAADVHHGHGETTPRARIRTALPVVTVGGLEAHPLFALALLDRVRELSRDPERETVILTAHGAGDDATDRHWHRLLESLAATMRGHGGDAFRDIRGGTWREDWPAQREAAVRELRAQVEEATRDGGRALVVPARTLGAGPERRYLDGLDFELGEGFAGHPLFVRWLEEQVAAGVERLRGGASPAPAAARGTAR